MHPSQWRKMTWALVLFVACIAIAITISSEGVSCGQKEQSGSQRAGCELQLSDQGGLAFCVGALGVVVLGLGWLLTRPSKPFPFICPNCGLPVKEGRSACQKCGYSVPAVETPATETDRTDPGSQSYGHIGGQQGDP